MKLFSIPAVTLAAILCLSSGAHASGVRIVDATGLRNYPDIQSAINAAVDGDVLLVGAGSYPGFTIDGKGLSIFVVPAGTQGATVGNVTVRNVLDKTAVLCGLSAGMLSVDNCSGYLGFQDCSFAGGGLGYNSSPAARVSGSVEIVFSRCTFVGHEAPPCGSCSFGPTGDIGLEVEVSTVALYGCAIQGGQGSTCCTDTGDGGPGGLVHAQSWLFAAHCSFTGGDSGDGYPGCWGGSGTWCGSSGDGLDVEGEFHALADDYSAGNAGASCCLWIFGSGIHCLGPAQVCDFLPGAARSLEMPWLSVDRTRWSLTLTGRPRDLVFLNRSLAPVFQYEPTLSGVCTSRLPPFPTVAPLGTVPLSGSLVVDVPQRLLPDNVVAQLYFLQGYVVDSAGATFLSTPLHTLSLNWNSLPDCNGNGINDYAEVIAGVTPDLDHDLKPDGCP